MSSEEQLTAEDVAWANMSYSERLVWWVNNKVLSKQELSQAIEEIQTSAIDDQQKQDDTTVHATAEQVQEQEQEEEQVEAVAEVNSDASQASPAKKRKAKKINISLP